MDSTSLSKDEVLDLMKTALSEMFMDHRDELREMIAEAIEDVCLGNAMEQVKDDETVSLQEILVTLNGGE